MSTAIDSDSESETNNSEVRGSLLGDVLREINTSSIPFTGERFVPGCGVEICYEHYNRYAFAASSLAASDIVLDLGCGTGYGSVFMSSFAKHVYSLDRDEASIAALRGLIRKAGITNITPIQGDIESISTLGLKNIDVVVCHELIEHVSRRVQRSIVEQIASGKAPFHPKTKFFVSTPERNRYALSRAEDNEFHECELSYDEFSDLLSPAFKNVELFWQSSSASNVIVPVNVASNGKDTKNTDVNFIHWKDKFGALCTMDSKGDPEGLYLYARASNGEIGGPCQSILIDQADRRRIELLAIAALELRNQSKEFGDEIGRLNELNKGLSDLLGVESDKIASLTRENESIAYNLELQKTRANLLDHKLAELATEIAKLHEHRDALLPWRVFVQRFLGPDLEHAAKAIERYQIFEKALSSPGHKAMTFVSGLIPTSLKKILRGLIRRS